MKVSVQLRTSWLQVSESTANFFHTLSNRFPNNTSLVIIKTEIRLILRIKVSIANRKLSHTLKISTKKMWIIHRMKERRFPLFPSFSRIPQLHSNSRLGKAFIHFRSELAHQKSLLHKRHLQFSLINIKAYSHKCWTCRNLAELQHHP